MIDIDKAQLPAITEVNTWTGRTFKENVTHNATCPTYNVHIRQLLHVAYKVAAEMEDEFIEALEKYETLIAEHVTENIFSRHIQPVFIGDLTDLTS